MAHQTLQAGAPNLPLVAGMTLKLEAIDPSTGNAVSGVTAGRWAIYGYDRSLSSGGTLQAPNPLLVPELTSI